MHAGIIVVMVIVAVFAALGIIALLKLGDSRFKNEPNQKNPFEGQRVCFVEDATKDENADGKRGYLKALGILESRC